MRMTFKKKSELFDLPLPWPAMGYWQANGLWTNYCYL